MHGPTAFAGRMLRHRMSRSTSRVPQRRPPAIRRSSFVTGVLTSLNRPRIRSALAIRRRARAISAAAIALLPLGDRVTAGFREHFEQHEIRVQYELLRHRVALKAMAPAAALFLVSLVSFIVWSPDSGRGSTGLSIPGTIAGIVGPPAEHPAFRVLVSVVLGLIAGFLGMWTCYLPLYVSLALSKVSARFRVIESPWAVFGWAAVAVSTIVWYLMSMSLTVDLRLGALVRVTAGAVAGGLAMIPLAGGLTAVQRLAQRRSWARFPQEHLAHSLFLALGLVVDTSRFASSMEHRQRLIDVIEDCVYLTGTALARRINAGDALDRARFADSLRARANAMRDLKQWVLTPAPTTLNDLQERISAYFVSAVRGEWDSFPVADERKSTLRETLTLVLSGVRTLTVGLLPGAALVLGEGAGLPVQPTVSEYWAVGSLLWLSGCCLIMLDPGLPGKLEAAKSISALFRKGGDGS